MILPYEVEIVGVCSELYTRLTGDFPHSLKEEATFAMLKLKRWNIVSDFHVVSHQGSSLVVTSQLRVADVCQLHTWFYRYGDDLGPIIIFNVVLPYQGKYIKGYYDRNNIHLGIKIPTKLRHFIIYRG
jgi:hypothetical protein